MKRVRLVCGLLLCAGVVSPAVAAPKSLGAPPAIEGVKRPLPKSYDVAPVLRFDGQTDCRAWFIETSAPASGAPPEDSYDGCAVIRRETANAPFGPPDRGGVKLV